MERKPFIRMLLHAVPFVLGVLLPLTHACSQDRVVVAGNKLLNFNAPAGQIPVSALPTPGGAGNYAGAMAQYSQNAQYDANGQLLFFIIDGNIYDREGYRIADNDADPNNCQQCLMKGLRQVGITLVPGTCDKYYIILCNRVLATSAMPVIGYAILDLSATNVYDPCRTGALVARTDVLEEFTYTEDNFQWSPRTINQGNLELHVNRDPVVQFGLFPDPLSPDWHGAPNNRGADLQFCIYEPTATNERKTLFVRDATKLYQAVIAADGIHYMAECSPDYEDFFGQASAHILLFSGGMDVRKGPGGVIRMAVTDNGSTNLDYGPEAESMWLGTVSFAAGVPTVTFGTAINTNVNNLSGAYGSVRSVAFSPNGRYIYFSQKFPPYVGYVDVNTPTVVNALSIASPMTYGQGTITCNKAPSGSGHAIYFPKTNGMGCFSGADNPTSGTWTADIPVSAALGTMPTSPYAADPNHNYISEVHFLGDMQVWNDQQIPALNLGACCVSNQVLSTMHVDCATLPSGTVNWSPGSNTLGIGSSSTAIFSEDFVIPAGVRLTVDNMTWRFAENARLIVQPGAFIRFTNCTLTSLDCVGARWPGVEARGNYAQPQGTDQYPTTQARLMLYNTVVENALIGVLAGARTQLVGPVLSSTSGGALINSSQNSRFINCREGVRFQQYQSALPNRSSFQGTTFTVNAMYPGIYDFQRHSYLWRVDGLRFTACHFKNERADNLFAATGSLALGHGIYSLDAQYIVEAQCPTCSETQMGRSTFIGLDHGIHALGGPSALYTFQVDQGAFTDNICGVYASGVTSFVVKRSNFSIGKRNVTLTNPEENPAPPTPGWGNHHRGLYSFSGYGFTVDDNTFIKTPGSPANRLTEGVVIGYSRDHNDHVFRNTGTNLTNGFVGEGICASTLPSLMPTIGLQFICNTNQNNTVDLWSRKITGAADANSHTIRTHQGATNRPADNVFDGWNGTGGKWDFLVTSTANPITYWHRNATTPYKPQNNYVTNFNMNPSSVTSIPQNNCASKVPGGGVEGMVVGTHEYLEAEKEAYENLRRLSASDPDGSELQLAMARHHANLSLASNLLIEQFTYDMLEDHTDDIRRIWQAIPTVGARYAEALSLMRQGLYSEAAQLVREIPGAHPDLHEREQAEQVRMLALVEFMQGVATSGRSDADLTSDEQDRLEVLISGAQDRPAVWAQNALCFHYGKCRTPWSGGSVDDGQQTSTVVSDVQGAKPLMRIFPNPANGWVTVGVSGDPSMEPMQLRVMDVLGKEVERRILNKGQQQVQFDTRGFPAGTYFVELLSGQGPILTEKLIVQP